MQKRTSWRDMDKQGTPFPRLREAYSVFNRTSGKSPATVKHYNERLQGFERYLGDAATLADVNVPTVRAFIAHLQERTDRHPNKSFGHRGSGALSSAYINGFVRVLRAFSTWLYEDGYTTENVLKPVKPPKMQQKVKEVLTDDEVRRLLAVFNTDDAYGARDFAMIWTFLDCGLRASELINLTMDDAHIEQGYLKVLGKGNKERLVPIGQRAQEALLRWRDRFRDLFVVRDVRQLFLNSSGEPLSVNALKLVLQRAGARASVPRVHLHLLRHTFATNYLTREVGDALRLQLILGHTSLAMVKLYIAQASLQQSILERRSSPMDLLTDGPAAHAKARRVQPRRPREGEDRRRADRPASAGSHRIVRRGTIGR
jgi:integrase/recombinase XerC/integrase/recombinase XerD